MTQIVFLAFGPRTDLYTQIYFALRSAQRWGEGNYQVTVLTDKPEFMSVLAEDIEIIELAPETLQEWRGEHDFMWRIKMKAIEHVARLHPDDHVLYFDSDVVIGKSLDSMIHRMDEGACFMHMAEKVISASTSSKDKRLFQALEGFEHLPYKFDKATRMYNAGVIGAPAGKSIELLANAIALCDALCHTSANKTYLEQLAFSMAFSQTGKLTTAEDTVIHFWGNKDHWNHVIEQYLLECRLKQLSKAQEIELMRNINFEEIPYYHRIQATNRRLKKFVDKCFPKERKTYFKG